MFKILRHYGVPVPMTNSICILYEGTRSVWGEYRRVVKWCFSVIPLYFSHVTDWVIWNTDIDDLGFITRARRFRRILGKKVGDLEYTNDTSLLEYETKNAQIKLNALSDVAKEIGFLINNNKIKVLARKINLIPEMMLDGTVLEVVEGFQYLRARVNDIMKDFKYRRTKTWKAFWNLKIIWDPNVDTKLKTEFFKLSDRTTFPIKTAKILTTRLMLQNTNIYFWDILENFHWNNCFSDVSHETFWIVWFYWFLLIHSV